MNLLALLRGINVGGNKKIPMADLREVAVGLGYTRVQTYIQSGNLVFAADAEPLACEAALAQAIAARCGFPVEVIVRTGARWAEYAAGSPFPDAERERPNLVLLGVTRLPTRPDAAQLLAPYATAGERIVVLPDAVWIDYASSVGTSKLTPAVLDRALGSTVTARNWRTVLAMAELAGRGAKG